jgi:hypothetical protein
MDDHITNKRLLEVAEKETRLTPLEFAHLDQCTDCLEVYAKSILQVARTRAQHKEKNNSSSSI